MCSAIDIANTDAAAQNQARPRITESNFELPSKQTKNISEHPAVINAVEIVRIKSSTAYP
jgi:hypothetical protein